MSSTYPGGASRRSGTPARGFGAPARSPGGLPYSRRADRSMRRFNRPGGRGPGLAPYGGTIPRSAPPGSPFWRAFKRFGLPWLPLALIPPVIEQLLPDYENGPVYDWSGWIPTTNCSYPVGAPRRWSEAQNGLCLLNQAVNYPAILPTDNYAALAITYELGNTGILRLANTQNFMRVVAGQPEIEPQELHGPLPQLVPVQTPVWQGQNPGPEADYFPVPQPVPLIPYMPASPPAPNVPGRQVTYEGTVTVSGLTPRWDIELPIVPGSLPRPVPETYVQARPPRGTKERKMNVYLRGGAVGIVNFATETGDFVEALHKALPKDCRAKPKPLGHWKPMHETRVHAMVTRDKSKVRYDAQTKTNLVWVEETEAYNRPRYLKKPRVLRHQGPNSTTVKTIRTHRAPTVGEMAEALYTCIEHMTPEQWVEFWDAAQGNLVDNTQEDFTYGQIGNTVKKANRALPGAGGLTLGPVL